MQYEFLVQTHDTTSGLNVWCRINMHSLHDGQKKILTLNMKLACTRICDIVYILLYFCKIWVFIKNRSIRSVNLNLQQEHLFIIFLITELGIACVGILELSMSVYDPIIKLSLTTAVWYMSGCMAIVNSLASGLFILLHNNDVIRIGFFFGFLLE